MGPCPSCLSWEGDSCEYCTYTPNIPMMIDETGFIHSSSATAEVNQLAKELGIKFQGDNNE